ncbi:hypothetical protein M3231_06315 [Neobacillus mesonae]|nr:hypothetical protein [Neobacillus mesonae]
MRNNKWNKYLAIGFVLLGLFIMTLTGRDNILGLFPILIGIIFVGIYVSRTFKEVRKTMKNEE